MPCRSGKYLLLGIAISLVGLSQVRAASIQVTSNELCAFKLEGVVTPGDRDRLAELIARQPPDPNNERTGALCLNSPGGSYEEGIKISKLIFSHNLSTVVTNGSECFSTCAFIFMAGVVPNNAIPYRKLSAGGVLGFHAPYLSLADGKYSKEDVNHLSQEMRESILALVRMSMNRTKLAANDFVKKSLLTRILENGPKEVFFVKTIGEAARWGIEIYDANEKFPQPNKLEEIKNICKNFHYSNMDELIPQNLDLSVKIDFFVSKYYDHDFRILVQDGRTKDTVCEIYPFNLKGVGDHVFFRACSFDYWSSKSFGDCREYKTRPKVLIGQSVPAFFTLPPETHLSAFH